MKGNRDKLKELEFECRHNIVSNAAPSYFLYLICGSHGFSNIIVLHVLYEKCHVLLHCTPHKYIFKNSTQHVARSWWNVLREFID